jgi:Protein of unknown function (DUF1553)/Protein of unknown function (DUF1549)/Planctomycete cytochrome C
MSVADNLPTLTCDETGMKSLFHCFLAAPFLTVCIAGAAPADDADINGDKTAVAGEGVDLFEQQILPVLVEHCYKCHSKTSETIEGGLELDSPSGMLRGGDTGAMFKAHHADEGDLLKMLGHEDGVSGMPPEEKLSDEIVDAFEKWIQLGAPDSRRDDGPTAKEERLTAAKGHWAFLPPESTDPPSVKDQTWSRDALIDNFVLARMEAEGLRPVADANRRTLVRRVFFDLIGLPPSPQDVDAFLADESPQALETLVDKLLASPQFGERWGRHWLDVVRFAESSGMEFNFTYPHAWPFRNYVIDSFNADRPFNQFLQEQIAGDLLPREDGESFDSWQSRQIATSVLAFGPKRHNSSGTSFQMDMADDQIDVVMKSTMAMTVSCARCHDHKFDPIPTTDYYALAGIFLSTEPLYGTIKQKYSNTPTDLLAIGEDGQAMHEAAEEYEKKIPEAEKSLVAKREELKKATDVQNLAVAAKTDAEGILAAVSSRQSATEGDDATSATDAAADSSEQNAAQSEVDRASESLTKAEADVATLTAEVAKMDAAVADLKKTRPPRPQYAMRVRDRRKPSDTKVAIRGDFRTRGDVVPRGFLSAVQVPDTSPVDKTGSGRLELARWITSQDNPLTARVMVNRIWRHLFGRGIVPTVDNFGLIGKPPTHPQLLDALALRFVDEDWSVKRMVRAMVLSRTYQLSSQVDEQNMLVDPGNRLLWRASPRRLEAEVIRDAILAVSGKLDLNRPTGSTVTSLGDKLSRTIPMEQLQPPSNRRSVYLPVVRDYVPELFDLFDFPSPSLVNGNRATTNVPSQALYLRNSAFVAEQAKFAAERLLASSEATDDASRVALAVRWALGRETSDAERAAALELIEHVRKDKEPANDVDAWSAWFLTLFSTAEFRYLVDVEA